MIQLLRTVIFTRRGVSFKNFVEEIVGMFNECRRGNSNLIDKSEFRLFGIQKWTNGCQPSQSPDPISLISIRQLFASAYGDGRIWASEFAWQTHLGLDSELRI